MGRFPDECAVEFKDGLGADDKSPGMVLGNGVRFGRGERQEIGADGKMGRTGRFGDAGRDLAEPETG
jgi:hypothetical protein